MMLLVTIVGVGEARSGEECIREFYAMGCSSRGAALQVRKIGNMFGSVVTLDKASGVKPDGAVSDGDANASQELAYEPLEPEPGLTSNIVESKVDSTASSTRAEDLRPKDLWDEAYNKLWNDKDKKKLIDAYEKFLRNTVLAGLPSARYGLYRIGLNSGFQVRQTTTRLSTTTLSYSIACFGLGPCGCFSQLRLSVDSAVRHLPRHGQYLWKVGNGNYNSKSSSMSNAKPWKRLVASSPSVGRHTLSKRRSTKLFLRSSLPRISSLLRLV
jgi:hypothetical protein